MWFPDKNDPDLERLAGLVFDLRRELFLAKHFREAHEREWETPEQEARRESDNESAVMRWDLETRRMILAPPPAGD